MRIAYIAPYQGLDLVKSRPCLHNLSLAARVKIQLVAELLQRSSHEVEIISQGEIESGGATNKHQFKFYPAFPGSERFHPDIPIFYASALSIRFITGFWESLQAQRLLKERHNSCPYDVVILYNLQRAQIGCAQYARRKLGLPVILQYEDDPKVNVQGEKRTGWLSRYHQHGYNSVLKSMSGGMGVSPYLLSQMPSDVPQMLLRGIVSDQIVRLREQNNVGKKNWVAFSGTHEGTQGLEQMVRAWRMLALSGWELHIAGQGPITANLEKLADGDRSIIFHGLLNREQNAQMLCAAKIGLNPQDVTKTPGNVFPFKIIEYLAAGNHVITTPRGSLEPELEAGVTYMPDNAPETIAASLKQVISQRLYERTAERAALQTYGPAAISQSLNRLLAEVTADRRPTRPMTRATTAATADAR